MKITKTVCDGLIDLNNDEDAYPFAADDVVVVVHTDEQMKEAEANLWAVEVLIKAPVKRSTENSYDA